MNIKAKIYEIVNQSKADNKAKIKELSKRVYLTDYTDLVETKIQNGKEIKIWTKALQKALIDGEIIVIDKTEEIYYTDNTIVISSNRRIEADKEAIIRLVDGVDVLMLRNEHTHDGTHKPISGEDKDNNISIQGGIWEEYHTSRMGYGNSGKYDKSRSFYGVSTCMLFNNLENLTLENVTFSHTGGFGVQVGNVKNAVFENIFFDECFADGVHINGNTENVLVKNVSGKVGDDLVALNMYDWLDSSVTFGPAKNVVVENLCLAEEGRYKALRILPGIYYYDNGTSVDCSLSDAVIKNVKGIKTIKMYFQTPRYEIGGEHEKGGVGTGDNIFFEDIEVDLDGPIDRLPEYMNSDSLRGSFGAFEIGANLNNLFFDNIKVTLHKDEFPLSYLACIGPKSSVVQDGTVEIFDPYISCKIGKAQFSNIFINGKKISDITPYVKQIEFDNINNDNHSTAKGEIDEIIMK